MSLSAPALSRLVEAAVRANHGCDECHMQVDAFAEKMLVGRSAAEALPLVERHLEMCPGCRDEFEALLTALRAAEATPAEARPWWQFWRR